MKNGQYLCIIGTIILGFVGLVIVIIGCLME